MQHKKKDNVNNATALSSTLIERDAEDALTDEVFLPITSVLEGAFLKGFKTCGLNEDTPLNLTVATKPEFGDFQVNGILAAAKALKTNPRQLAEQVVAQTDVSTIATLSVAGPGFINIVLKDSYLQDYLTLAKSHCYSSLFVMLKHRQRNPYYSYHPPGM